MDEISPDALGDFLYLYTSGCGGSLELQGFIPQGAPTGGETVP